MLMKVSDLTGAALDYTVAVAEGATNLRENPHKFNKHLILTLNGHLVFVKNLRYSTDWGQGGPIIEREKVVLSYGLGIRSNLWFAEKYQCYAVGRNTASQQYGPTPLIAAMRCYVASKLGDTVEIPDEIGAKQ
jgi:hypothetical protein